MGCGHVRGAFWVGHEDGWSLDSQSQELSASSHMWPLAALSGSPVFINAFKVFKGHHFSSNLTPKYKDIASSGTKPKNNVG